MADPVPAADLDVFLSYKREEKGVAEALANFLIGRGYDIWWDDALLAGENFADIVHSQLLKSRAVVVLWSKQARASHWVRDEAALALAQGTLINAVIDGMAFEGIPPEFSHIQAIRLEDDATAFHEAVAAAIARKGATPHLSARTPGEARTTLAGKVKDAELFSVIANRTHVGDFEDYLAAFGDDGQFASLARRRIAALEKAETQRSAAAVVAEAERKSFRRRIQLGAVAATAVVAVGANLATILAFLYPPPATPTPDPTPPVTAPDPQPPATTPDPGPILEPGTPITPPATADTILPNFTGERPSFSDYLSGTTSGLSSTLLRAALSGPQADLTVTRADGTTEGPLSAHATWTTGSSAFSANYDAAVTFAGGLPANLSFNSWQWMSTQVRADLTVDPADPHFAGLSRIESVSADGAAVPGAPSDTGTGFIFNPGLSIFDTPLETLATAASIGLALSYLDGSTATLTFTAPPDPDAMRKAITPPPLASTQPDLYNFANPTPSVAE